MAAVNLATVIDGHPDEAVAIISQGRATTYGELRRQVAGFRTGLVELGVEPGDRVALLCANNWLFVVSYLAALGAGAVVVPLNPADVPASVERELARTGTRVVIVGPAGEKAMAGVDRLEVPVEHVLAPKGVRLDGADPVEDHFLVDRDPLPVVDRAPSDVALLVFTAGTAGAPRPAMLTHGNLLANIEQAGAVEGRAIRPDDVVYGVLPLFHIFGLNVVLGQALHAGATVALAERFDPVESLRAVKEKGITVLAGPPPIWVAWATMPGADPSALATVRLAVSGAAPLPVAVAEQFEARFGVPLFEGYGLTEASPIVTSSAGLPRPRYGSVGVPLPGVEVRLVDEDGEDALDGDPGEVWVRGPNVFVGYLDDPETTAAVLSDDGWLRTGDVGVADDDGYLWLVDRVKDLVIVSGFNVYPAEVEDALLAHPGIADVAVVGEPDPYTGETIKAYVVPVAGRQLDEDEVLGFCAGRLATYKCPTRVQFVDEIPRGMGGKALRRELR